MKNRIHLFAFICLFILPLISCQKPGEADNEISDPEGIRVELSWANGEAEPTATTDLDLHLHAGFNSLLSSSSSNEFESFEIATDAIASGVYDVGVYVDKISKPTNYTLAFTGVSTGKTYSLNFGSLLINDVNSVLKPVQINVQGRVFNIL